METLERLLERRHRQRGISAQFDQAIANSREVTVFGIGHRGQLGLVGDRRRKRRVSSESLEGHELAVGEYTEQIDDSGAVCGVRERSILSHARSVVGGTLAFTKTVRRRPRLRVRCPRSLPQEHN